jgi:hypothetical protein
LWICCYKISSLAGTHDYPKDKYEEEEYRKKKETKIERYKEEIK